MYERKNIIITGASSGIGLETAKRLQSDGNTIFSLSRRNSELLSNLPDCHQYKVDVKQLRDISDAAEYIKRQLGDTGKVDVLINNAGVGWSGKIGDVTEEIFDDYFDTNIKGLVFVTQKFLPLIKDNVGMIINISSIAGIKPFAEWSIYCATKFAVQGFSQSLRMELRPRGIAVVNIQPGAVNTPAYNRLNEKERIGFIAPNVIADMIATIISLPNETVVEEIFINNRIGDL